MGNVLHGTRAKRRARFRIFVPRFAAGAAHANHEQSNAESPTAFLAHRVLHREAHHRHTFPLVRMIKLQWKELCYANHDHAGTKPCPNE
jgi:hypothetical protein